MNLWERYQQLPPCPAKYMLSEFPENYIKMLTVGQEKDGRGRVVNQYLCLECSDWDNRIMLPTETMARMIFEELKKVFEREVRKDFSDTRPNGDHRMAGMGFFITNPHSAHNYTERAFGGRSRAHTYRVHKNREPKSNPNVENVSMDSDLGKILHDRVKQMFKDGTLRIEEMRTYENLWNVMHPKEDKAPTQTTYKEWLKDHE